MMNESEAGQNTEHNIASILESSVDPTLKDSKIYIEYI